MPALSVEQALYQRRSTRQFINKSIPRKLLEKILIDARQAPSGANLQPGFVKVLEGKALQQLSEKLCAAFDNGETQTEEYSYFPKPLPDYLKTRQRTVGYGLYNSLNIARRDIAGRKQQHRKNFEFFSAPVGLIITIERQMGKGCFMDMGMFIQSILLAATAEGVATCGIGALASYSTIIRQQLKLPDNEIVVCGMAMGYADPQAPENQLITERAALSEYVEFIDSGD
ncbi:MAG: nitroreductase [Arenicella sp.]